MLAHGIINRGILKKKNNCTIYAITRHIRDQMNVEQPFSWQFANHSKTFYSTNGISSNNRISNIKQRN